MFASKVRANLVHHVLYGCDFTNSTSSMGIYDRSSFCYDDSLRQEVGKGLGES